MMAVSYLPKELIPMAKNRIDYKASCYDDLNIEKNLQGAIEMVELPCEIC